MSISHVPYDLDRAAWIGFSDDLEFGREIARQFHTQVKLEHDKPTPFSWADAIDATVEAVSTWWAPAPDELSHAAWASSMANLLHAMAGDLLAQIREAKAAVEIAENWVADDTPGGVLGD